MNFFRLLKDLLFPGPRFLIVRDGVTAVGAYYLAKDAREDASELNEDAMFSGQPRRYEVMHRKVWEQRNASS